MKRKKLISDCIWFEIPSGVKTKECKEKLLINSWWEIGALHRDLTGCDFFTRSFIGSVWCYCYWLEPLLSSGDLDFIVGIERRKHTQLGNNNKNASRLFFFWVSRDTGNCRRNAGRATTISPSICRYKKKSRRTHLRQFNIFFCSGPSIGKCHPLQTHKRNTPVPLGQHLLLPRRRAALVKSSLLISLWLAGPQ